MLEKKIRGITTISNVFAMLPHGERANGFYSILVDQEITILYAHLRGESQIAEFQDALNHAAKLLKAYNDTRTNGG